MAKHITPEMERINRRRRSRSGRIKRSSPGRDAWRRLCRNPTALLGLAIVILLVLAALLAPVIAPYDYARQDYSALNVAPCLEHPFGTDRLGRDLLSRCIYGTRISLPIAVLSVAAAALAGGTVGTCAAYFGGRVDNILMRICDIWGSIPGLLLAIAIVACLGNNVTVLVIGLSVGAIPNMARGFRGAVFTVIGNDYVESSRSIGASGRRIMVRHLIPNAIGPIIINVVQLIGVEILSISTLSYIGVGVQPPTPEWGSLLSYGKEFMSTQPYMVLFPGLCIMLAVIGFNLLGDGLRDALDPRLK